ncbi:HET domain-containing protein [Pyrenophora tritici-repentis]|uniref:Heterokaryon incompatibility protein n=2 Tax=Pyrenophora tritici-repentis TaxID=45151 RepID=A0A2W1GH35_9PLEO|nr:HET domain containing protein [Pyrenophora tritici-repentis]KAI0577071.1 HET domain-containing protein [Pyrenophora tritici-repentis]KAI0619779.1 HET domain-containing protein [Pyrenophora tritici-repentis]KAI1515428.1 Heterokaryon incompatibility protein [Pyrenophora tritici-repentis]KAI1536272.1 HET domain containing protein [Pyrenophora tritici-repentis]
MRLLDATTLEFRTFTDDQFPPYVILSHTWGDEEVTYQEMRFLQQFDALPDNLKHNTALIAAMEAAAGLKVSLRSSEIVKHRSGYRKIIDTCCINKSSSAELQEAINSMFTWYKRSNFCVVYLESVDRLCRSGEEFQTALQDSKWTWRGWTLQELIAPISVKFYNGDWVYICTKDEWARHIAAVTGISEIILLTGDLDDASVAQKMSWAATRQTTRKEDKAYSLMGLFGIHVPMLYGEGDNAFLRLQEEIIRTCLDDSIFAWRSPQGSVNSHRGLLANSPEDFKDFKNITRGSTDTGMEVMEDITLYFCALKATRDEGAIVTLMLRRLGPCNFARVEANRFFNWCGSSRERTFYIEHTPEILRQFRSGFMHCFHLKPSPTEADYKFIPEKWALKIENVRPQDLWDPEHHELRIPELPHRLWEEKDLANYPFFSSTILVWRTMDHISSVWSG